MFKSEEHKLDKLEEELLNIEKFAKNLDLNSKDEDRMVLTNIVSETQNVPKDQSKNDLINSFNHFNESKVDGIVACTEYTHAHDLVVQDDDNLISPLINYNKFNELYSNKKILFDCGAFSWIKVQTFFNERNWVANKAIPYILPHYKGVDLDTVEDFELLSFYYKKYVLKEV